MATQSLDFAYTTGQTLTAKLFAVGSDTVTATASSVTEQTNRKGRYYAVFTDVAAADYLLVYFLGGSGAGSEYYTLTLTTATFTPWSEIKAATPANVTAAIDAVGPGNGARRINITASVGGVAVAGVRVRISGSTRSTETGVLGTAFLDVEGGSPAVDYTLLISTPSGYEDEDSVVVSVGTTNPDTVAIALTANTYTAAPIGKSSLRVHCVDEAGADEEGVTIYGRIADRPSGGTGVAYKGSSQSDVSDVNGIATLVFPRLAKVEVRRGTTETWTAVTMDDDAETLAPSFVGAP